MPWKREFFPPEKKFDYSVIQKRCEEINFEFFKKLQPYALDTGVELAIENIYTSDAEFREQCPSGCSRADEWIKYIDTLGKGFCACLDTGHANLTDKDDKKLNETVERLGERLKTLHVNQNYGKFSNYGDFHQPPLLGDIDLVSFAKTLKKTGYKGDFNYEVVLSTVDKELFLAELKYLKIYTDYLYKLL
jgi:sugar phosphate isomerase/epimerase